MSDSMIVLIVLSITQLGTLLLFAYRLRRHLLARDRHDHKRAEQASVNLFRQIQSLIDLRELLVDAPALPPLRGWAASPDFLLVAAGYALKRTPSIIVECGSGASTIVLAHCCRRAGSGHVYTLDHDSRFAQQTRDRLSSAGLSQWATVIDSALVLQDVNGIRKLWYDITDLPASTIDMLLVDGPPMPIDRMIRHPAVPILWSRLSADAIILVDDSLSVGGELTVKRWETEFPTLTWQDWACEKGCRVFYRARAN